jgi:hypothetical protein
MRIRCLLAVALFALPAATLAQDVEAGEPVCRTGDIAKSLDFWVGEWRVVSRDGTTEYGTNRIERVLDGCAVFEHWRSQRGGEGKSLFYFDAHEQEWTQVWVTPDTTRPGGLKVKHLVARFGDGGVRFQGSYSWHEGRMVLDRTTLTPEADGKVRQLIEVSLDGGESWEMTFDATYVPVE